MRSFVHIMVIILLLAIIISVAGNESKETQNKSMVKLIILAKRNPSMTVEQFQYYLRYEHPKKVESIKATRKYIRRYEQSHTLMSEYTNGNPPYDAIVELWFDSIADKDKFYTDPDYVKMVRPDEFVFADVIHTDFILTEEVVII
jgi:hypothetical protein